MEDSPSSVQPTYHRAQNTAGFIITTGAGHIGEGGGAHRSLQQQRVFILCQNAGGAVTIPLSASRECLDSAQAGAN